MDFVDLKTQYQTYQKEIDHEIRCVLKRADFVMGKAVFDFEKALSNYTGSIAIGCSNGTDALLLALMALDIKPGDEVITTPYSFVATAEVIAFLKAKPVFVDIETETYNLNVDLIEQAISDRTKAIIPVSLFGEVADMARINQIANRYGLAVIEDAAQSFGAVYQDRKSTHLSMLATTSFFPAKPLGGYGEGGAVFTDQADLGEKIRSLLNHGQSQRYRHDLIGINGRLDSLQAAVLKIKLKHLDQEIIRRNEIADHYQSHLDSDFFSFQRIDPQGRSARALFSLTVPDSKTPALSLRTECLDHLADNQIPTAIYYPIPLHLQQAFSYLKHQKGDFPISEKISETIFSIPIHPFLKDSEVERVTEVLNQFASFGSSKMG